MFPPTPRRHIRFKGTRSLKEAAQRQLTKFRDKIQEQDRADSDFWNPRVKNLMEDIDELSKDIYETTKRLGIDISLMDAFTSV